MSIPQLGVPARPSPAIQLLLNRLASYESQYEIYAGDLLFRRLMNCLSGRDGGLLENLISTWLDSTPNQLVRTHILVGPLLELREITLQRMEWIAKNRKFISMLDYQKMTRKTIG